MSLKWTVLLLLVAGCSGVPVDTVHRVELRVNGVPAGVSSGVMIAPKVMLTAAHVVSNQPENSTFFVGGKPAKVLRADQGKDLALLMVELGCPCASLGETPTPNTEVVKIGFPKHSTIALQVVTYGRAQGVAGGEAKGLLLHTANMTHGDSGGGVFVRHLFGWRLVGITSQMVNGRGYSHFGPVGVPLAYLSLAVTAEAVKEFLNSASVSELDAIKSASV